MQFTSDESDTALVERAQQGNLDAFNQLAHRYEGQIYNVSLRTLADPQLAQDVTQDTLLRAYRGLARFRGGSLRAWLLRIASNACMDLFRSRRASPDVSLELLTEGGVQWASESRTPEEEALRGELGREIQRGLMKLPQDQRMALVLVDVEGLSYEEAAETLAISPGTLRSRLSRARSKMRDHMLQKRELLPSFFRQR